MKFPHLQLKSRSTAIAAVAAVVIGAGGWAFAEGGVPLISSPAADTEATTTTTEAPATAGAGTDNVAVASNTKDGKTVIAISLKIVQTDASTVDAMNAAVAVASCSDCQTVAIALEGVLIIGDAATFSPTNIALALNTGCSNCQTLATAYQQIVQNDTRVRISGSGRQQIASIRRDLESLRNSGLDIFAIQQRVEDAAAQLLSVLRTEVYPIGRPSSSTTSTSTTATSTTIASSASTTTTSTPAASTTVVPVTTSSSSTTTTLP